MSQRKRGLLCLKKQKTKKHDADISDAERQFTLKLQIIPRLVRHLLSVVSLTQSTVSLLYKVYPIRPKSYFTQSIESTKGLNHEFTQ